MNRHDWKFNRTLCNFTAMNCFPLLIWLYQMLAYCWWQHLFRMARIGRWRLFWATKNTSGYHHLGSGVLSSLYSWWSPSGWSTLNFLESKWTWKTHCDFFSRIPSSWRLASAERAPRRTPTSSTPWTPTGKRQCFVTFSPGFNEKLCLGEFVCVGIRIVVYQLHLATSSSDMAWKDHVLRLLTLKMVYADFCWQVNADTYCTECFSLLTFPKALSLKLWLKRTLELILLPLPV